jgi:hypothetical protein
MKTSLLLLSALCSFIVAAHAQDSLPSIRILPEDIVQTSIQQTRSGPGTNQFGVRWTYTDEGAKKMLTFWNAHAGEKTLEQVGDFEYRATRSKGKPKGWTEEEEGWLKWRTDKFFGVTEADAKKITAGLTAK